MAIEIEARYGLKKKGHKQIDREAALDLFVEPGEIALLVSPSQVDAPLIDEPRVVLMRITDPASIAAFFAEVERAKAEWDSA